MADMINYLQQPRNAVIFLAVLFILLIFVSLAIFFRRRETRLDSQISTLKESLRKTAEDVLLRDDADAQKESGAEQMRSMADSMMRSINDMGHSLQGQMDSFHTQMNGMNLKDEQRMDAMRRLLDERMRDYDQRMREITQSVDAKLENLTSTSREQIDGIRSALGENLEARLGSAFQTVNERLEKVYQGLDEMQGLSEGVINLRKVLTNVKVRGIWGEASLAALLEQMLAPNQYEKNVAVNPGSGETVEFAVRMPGQGDELVYLPIVPHFPHADYERLLDAMEEGDPAATEDASKLLERVITEEARRINDKFIRPPYTTDFALMFLPVEGLYAEVLRRPGLQETLQKENRVVIAGPTTLAALLNSLQMGFRTLAIERRTTEVWELLGQVKTAFTQFLDVLEDGHNKIQQAGNSLESIKQRGRALNNRLKEVEPLPLDDPHSPDYLVSEIEDDNE